MTSGPRGAVTSRTSSRLGWRHQSLLIWALTGWTLATLLGVVLLFHMSAGDDPPAPKRTPAVQVDTATQREVEVEPAPIAPEVMAPTVEPEAVASLPPFVETEAEPEPSNAEAVIAAYLRHAAEFTEAGEFDRAIEAYDQAITHDPHNVDFVLLREQVVELREAAKRTGSTITLSFRESRTEYIGPPADVEGGRFPEARAGVSIRRATSAPEFPGELIMSLRPRAFEPGAPYVLSVRLYNSGNRVIGVELVEIEFELDGRVEGRNLRQAPIVARANPRDTALLLEETNVWQEGQSSGEVAVTVDLIGGAQLKKTISW